MEVTLKALRVFTDILKYIVGLMLERLRRAHGDSLISKEDIKWVLTVPAMWKASARDFMRQAAREVCMSWQCLYIHIGVNLMS